MKARLLGLLMAVCMMTGAQAAPGKSENGKTVVPFMTHGGGGEQNCFSDFKKHAGKATVKKGFYVGGGQVGSAGPQVEAWLREIKMK